MVFASYEFIFWFFPFVFAGYFLLSKFESFKFQHLFLVLSSLVFYAWFNVSYLWIILSSILINYLISKWMNSSSDQRSRKFIFILGIAFNIFLLGYYKYYDFFADNFNSLFGTSYTLKYILLPLGISFITFQQIAFLLSSYRNEWRNSDFLRYCLCVLFFPHLIAGPIVLYSELMPQFGDNKRRFINWENIASGFYIFVLGLFKKIVIADTLAVWANNGFDNMGNIGFFAAWATALAYTLQIYFDFSGYSEMAIGLAKMLNIDLPANFKSPYKARNIGEFWRRWHITLSRALSEFIYKPLGGNRKGEYRTYLNIGITFFISGFWHGASWLFIIWGVLHGFASIIHRIWTKTGFKMNHYVAVLITFLFINFTWVIFRATSMEQAIRILKAMVIPKSFDVMQIGLLYYDGIMNLPTILCTLIILATLLTLLIIVFKATNALELAAIFKVNNLTVWKTSVALFVSIICLGRSSVFIYFNF
nr:MBOAT family O-acyltransferase [Paenibacillus harenae]